MAKSDKPSVNKADFVRSIGLDVRAKDVVQRAEASGFSLSEAYVYGVRKEMAASGAAKAADKNKAVKPGRPTAAPLAPLPPAKRGPSGPRAGSKKAFVLSFPNDTPARDILAAASLKGMEMSAGYVYWVRSDATRNGRKAGLLPVARPTSAPARPAASAPARPGAAASINASANAARTRGSEAERLIVDTAIRVVGIERAIAILEAARGKLDRLIGDLSPVRGARGRLARRMQPPEPTPTR
jgi:hypothetical protein